jgi:hypothetical protein
MAENGSNGNGASRFLPEEVWQELRSLLGPGSHFFGEYRIVIHDSQLVRTERISHIRTSRRPDSDA